MDALTPERKRAIERASDAPVRLTDSETQRTSVLVSTELYERLLGEEDRRQQAAFLRAAKQNPRTRLMSECEPG
jgi:hypothetical protein